MTRIPRLSIASVLALGLSSAIAAAEPARPELASGDATARNGVLVAGPSGAEWRVPGGPRVAAAPGASLRVLSSPQPLLLGPGAAVPGYTLVVRSGKVEISVPAGAKSAIVLVAPRQLGAIVRSGVVRIAADGAQTAVANVSGETTLSAGGGVYRPLARGRVHVAGNGGSGARELVPAPKALSGRRLVVTSSGLGALGGLSWDAVEGATGYHAELLDEASGQLVGEADSQGPALERPFDALPVGRYRLRVSAQDPSGVASARGLEAPVRVIGLELPPGAYADTAGAIRLGRGQKVRFEGAEGLEMTYGGDRFFRAASRVGLFRNDRTLVHLRLPNTHEFASVRLEPRTVRAKIEIGPATATWPKDPIEIRVRLEDPSGQPIPPSIEAKPRVRLGVRELDVAFTEKGGWLRAVVPPQAGSGPWVLRVAVEDGAAQPLGYDFLEIVRGPTPPEKRLTLPARLEAVSRR